jgi:hypothetical protein
MRRLVADEGEPGEDHSECTGNQRLQPGVVEVDQPGHRITQRGQQTSEEDIEPTRAAPAARGFGRPANAKQVCGVTRLIWVRAAVGRAPTERPSSGPLSPLAWPSRQGSGPR